jgi:hypothetical protein
MRTTLQRAGIDPSNPAEIGISVLNKDKVDPEKNASSSLCQI